MLHTDSQTELFPACAGVILNQNTMNNQVGTFPRLRGGDPYCHFPSNPEAGFSPPAQG